MKDVAIILIACFSFQFSSAQYYLRGEIKDENNNPLSNVKILLHSSGYLYYSGSSGGFGIPIPRSTDSLTVSADGFETLLLAVDAGQFQTIGMKVLFKPVEAPKRRLLSLTKNLKPSDWKGWTVGHETYSSLIENEFVPASKFPETGFAMTIDKASYSNVRRFLNMGSTIPPDAVRIEELLNYFNFGYVPPHADSSFYMSSTLSECPWNKQHQLMFLKVCARKVDTAKIPPANLVFLIDISGSMDMPNKLPLLKSSFQLLVNNLRQMDTVSIVVYGSSVGVWMPPTPGNRKKEILKAIEDLEPGGPTPGEAGIQAAYRVAMSQFITGGNNRVILATDGDFNVGETSEQELEKLISLNKRGGVYLTCLGVGMGNYKDSKLEVLAKKGNGNFAYLDNEREAEKVLVEEFTQTLYVVADDAYLNIEFNPDLVKNYRLIGFDNKLQAMTDTLNEIQGGEVGSGHSLMAMFELTPVEPDSIGQTADRSRLASVQLHYRRPGDSIDRMTRFDCQPRLTHFDALPNCYRFASSIALFGGLLKRSKYVSQSGWKNALLLARQSCDPEDGIQKELISLIEKARKIYGNSKRPRPDE
ncbi:MAG: von Willebrand factor type A domain-containing protein [Bacteroidota bacterium]|nr:von Willebrand factor type A domain-containing protein [Bacteroidota bacterium]MDP4217054.1 von Willebrand factor type A domain-containing protein [Bacteroidota bacterium]MDP4244501.1 von Willebrand factor type A domain-containing protein [Bacteroidota bacterium]MDP4256042.1 von Willebrand factor type A domain-containing protein [Bacteroidota bacterium]MDP4258744.1 von Willebrand factor type A domain-containing protein [Bacteroidota bacterium]